jgi:hypothetical protein
MTKVSVGSATDIASIISAIINRENGFLGAIDTIAQVAASAASITNEFEENVLTSATTVLTGGFALATGSAVLAQDVHQNKGLDTYINDSATVLGDLALVMGGTVSLLGPAGQKLGAVLDDIGVMMDVVGVYEQNKQKVDGSSLDILSPATLSRVIGLFEEGIQNVSANLNSTNSVLLSSWAPLQAHLIETLDFIKATVNSTGGNSFSANANATINALDSLQSSIYGFYDAATSDTSLSVDTTSWASASPQHGYYIGLPGDTAQSIVNALSANGAFNVPDAATLTRINAVFGVDLSAVSAGTLVHVSVDPYVGDFAPLGGPFSPKAGQTLVFDPANNSLSSVGASLDGHDAGALIIDTPLLGGFATFDSGTYSGVTMQPNGEVAVTLITPDGMTLGTLAINASTDAGTFTLSDGEAIAVPGGFAIHLTDPAETPEQVLLSYLSELGVSTTSASLDAQDFGFLNPTGAAYTVAGDIQKVDDTHANVFYSVNGTPGAVVAGQPTAEITDYVPGVDDNGNPIEVPVQVNATAYNILAAGGDISQDAITGIQELDTGGVALTHAQFQQFADIKGSGTITAADGGTFDLNDSNIDPSGAFNLAARDWSGTTLIGNNTAGQTLTASLFGNDTLHAGNGAGDMLVAGEGVDTLIGGTGGDTFVAYNGLASGSVIAGNGNNNVLQVLGDITGATITDVQTLEGNDITLTAAQLAEFSTIDIGGTITAATGGTFDLANSLSNSMAIGTDMIAGTDDGTTLIGSDSAGETLIASPTGNDTLIGNGSYNNLDATDTAGNNTLSTLNTAYDGAINYLDVSGSTGNNVLTVGNRENNELDASFTLGDNHLTAGDGAYDRLNVEGSDGNNVLTVGNGNYPWLIASDSVGDNTLTIGNGDFAEVQVDDSAGNNTITIGNGATVDISADNSEGDNILTVGNGDNDTIAIFDSIGDNTLTVGGGNGDVVYASGALGNDAALGNNKFVTGFGSSTIYGGDGDNTYVFSGAGSGHTLILNIDTGSNQSVIQFTAGVSPSQVSLAQSGNDLVLTVGSEVITVQNYLAGTGHDINAIEFADGTVWDQNAIASDLPLVVNGSISLTADQFNAHNSIEGSGTIFATTAGTYDLEGKASVPLNMMALASGGTILIGNDANFESLAASGLGTDMLHAGNGNRDILAAGHGNDTLIGGNGGDFFIGGVGHDMMYGGTGNDVFYAGSGDDYMQGGNGNNTYNFTNASPSGNYTINDYHTDNGQSVLEFGAGVTASEVIASQSGNDLVLTIGNDPITVQNFFSSSSYQLSGVQFADGTDWSTQQIETMVGYIPGGSPPLGYGVLRAGGIVSPAPDPGNNPAPPTERLDAPSDVTAGNATAGSLILSLVAQPIGTTQTGQSGSVSFSQGGEAFVFANLSAPMQTSAPDWFALDQGNSHAAFSQAAEVTTNSSSFFVGAETLNADPVAELPGPVVRSFHPSDGFHLV